MSVVDVASARTAHELHSILAVAFAFPEYYGKNWDAFWDCICDSDQSDFPDALEVRGISALEARLPREAALFRKCLADFREEHPSFSYTMA